MQEAYNYGEIENSMWHKKHRQAGKKGLYSKDRKKVPLPSLNASAPH